MAEYIQNFRMDIPRWIGEWQPLLRYNKREYFLRGCGMNIANKSFCISATVERIPFACGEIYCLLIVVSIRSFIHPFHWFDRLSLPSTNRYGLNHLILFLLLSLIIIIGGASRTKCGYEWCKAILLVDAEATNKQLEDNPTMLDSVLEAFTR